MHTNSHCAPPLLISLLATLPFSIYAAYPNTVCVPQELTFGERIIMRACTSPRTDQSAEAELKRMIVEENISPQFIDPETKLSPFGVALHHNLAAAGFLLRHGAKPHAHLKDSESIYSHGFERGDTATTRFILAKRIPYLPRKRQGNRKACKAQDLRRLIQARNTQSLRVALSSGIINPKDITQEAIGLVQSQKHVDPTFAKEALALLFRSKNWAQT